MTLEEAEELAKKAAMEYKEVKETIEEMKTFSKVKIIKIPIIILTYIYHTLLIYIYNYLIYCRK